MPKKATNKNELLRFRCTLEEKKTIEEAAEIDERKISDFLRYHSLNKSKEILNQYGGYHSLMHFLSLEPPFQELFKKYLKVITLSPKLEKYFDQYYDKSAGLREDKELDCLLEEEKTTDEEAMESKHLQNYEEFLRRIKAVNKEGLFGDEK